MKILDISKHQKGIVLSSLIGVDGYIFRATIGSSSYDECVEDFIAQAKAINKPYGFYVADYAHNTANAIAEADKVCDLAAIHGVDFPIFFDTEYFSNQYITAQFGISHSLELVQSITTAFCERVKERGYKTGVYFNKDYYTNYYGGAAYFNAHPDYVKWFARPGLSAPDVNCDLWQYASNEGTEFGYNANIDKNEVINFAHFAQDTWVDCNIEYQITVSNCEYFYSADVYDTVGYLQKDQVIKAHSKSVGQIGGFDWIKIHLNNDPIEYYVAVIDNRMIKIKETEPGYEECNIQYITIASNCQYFYSADVYDVVDYLPKGQIITAYEKSIGQIGGFNWVKTKLENDETVYYVVILPDRIVEYVEEPQPDPTPEPSPGPTPENPGGDNVIETHKAFPLSGSNKINFNVVGGSIAPASTKNNTVWVETPIEVSKWSLSGKEPTSPIDGQVWVKMINPSDKTSFNVLQDKAINIQTENIYQWNNNKWEKQNGALYQNGVITQNYYTTAVFDIYRNGISSYSPTVKTGTGITGTWGSIGLGSDSITFNSGSQYSIVSSAISFKTPVDVTNCNKIRVYLNGSAQYYGNEGYGHGRIRVCAASSPSISSTANVDSASIIYADTGEVNHTAFDLNGNASYGTPKTKGYIDLDVNALTGNVYIIVLLSAYYVRSFSGNITAVASVE